MAIYSKPFTQNVYNPRHWIRETNLLLNPIKLQRDIDKSYSHAKDSYKAKYLLLSNKRKSVGLKHYNDSKAFIKY